MKVNNTSVPQNNSDANSKEVLSGFWFRCPDELDLLMRLRPAELRVYLVVMHAIQRDRHGGLLAMSQISSRAGLSVRHARAAIDELCQRRLLMRVNRATGAELSEPREWNGRTVTYATPVQWRQRDASNLVPTGDSFAPANQPAKSPPTENQQDTAYLEPLGARNLAPVGTRHLELLELKAEKEKADYCRGGETASPPRQAPVSPPSENQESKADEPRSPRWTGLDVANVGKILRAMMDDEPPPGLMEWIVEDLAPRNKLSAADVCTSLRNAWARARKGNRPRRWSWVYEVLRNAHVPGYAARAPEPTAPQPAIPPLDVEAIELPDAPDSLIASARCKCGAEIRQYRDRIVGRCTCVAPAVGSLVSGVPARMQPGREGLAIVSRSAGGLYR